MARFPYNLYIIYPYICLYSQILSSPSASSSTSAAGGRCDFQHLPHPLPLGRLIGSGQNPCTIRMPDYGRIMFPEHDVRPNGVRNFHDLLKSHGPHCFNHFLQVCVLSLEREILCMPACVSNSMKYVHFTAGLWSYHSI